MSAKVHKTKDIVTKVLHTGKKNIKPKKAHQQYIF